MIKLSFTKLCIRILSCLLLFGLSHSAVADSDVENRLKAALIYKMGLYVTWSNTPSQVNYCFIGQDSQGVSEILELKFNQGKLPKSVSIVNKDSIRDVEKYECQIIFAPVVRANDDELYQSLSQASLTIAANSKELKHGLIASIEIVKGKPVLAVSKSNLKSSNIKIDTRLLAAVTFKD